MTVTGALFDLDGVLIDTEGVYTRFWDGIGREFNAGIPDFAYAIKGTTLTEILEKFPEEDREEITRRIHDFEDTMVYVIFPGVIDFLTELRERGIPRAVVTSSDNVKMECLYAQHPHFKELFDVVITGSMVTNSKPHPEGYLRAAEAIGCKPEDCFVFEDSMQGLEAGRRSGATVIGLATTNPREAIKDKADEVIDGFTGFTVDKMLSVRIR